MEQAYNNQEVEEKSGEEGGVWDEEGNFWKDNKVRRGRDVVLPVGWDIGEEMVKEGAKKGAGGFFTSGAWLKSLRNVGIGFAGAMVNVAIDTKSNEKENMLFADTMTVSGDSYKTEQIIGEGINVISKEL